MTAYHPKLVQLGHLVRIGVIGRIEFSNVPKDVFAGTRVITKVNIYSTVIVFAAFFDDNIHNPTHGLAIFGVEGSADDF